MSTDDRISSDDSSDCFQLDQSFPGRSTSTLKPEWEAIESYLYQEDDPNIVKLKPKILQECRIWRESFPYLRVRGRKIEDPRNDRKSELKQQVVDAVVDRVIAKISSGLSIARDPDESDKLVGNRVQRPNAASRESYFERGKSRGDDEKGSLPKESSIKINPDTQDSTQTTTAPLPLPKAPPRGILKNSPARLAQQKRNRTRKRERPQRPPTYPPKSTFLPRIATKNNWIEQSARCEDRKSYYRSQNDNFRSRQPSRPIASSDYFILPAINPNLCDK